MRNRVIPWFAITASLFGITCLGGCDETLPPPPVPPKNLPVLEGPVTAGVSGTTRVIIATDVPARVEQIHGPRAAGKATLCETTPCVVTLPAGDYELNFRGIRDGGRTSTSQLRVGGPSLAMNHTLGQDRTSPGQVVGPALMVVGGVLLVGALAKSVMNGSEYGVPPSQRDETSNAASVMALLGLGSVVGGGIILGTTPNIQQPGSTTVWTPAFPTARGASAGWRF